MKKPKKILIFSVTYYPSLVGGDVVAVKEITERLAPQEFEFHLVTLRFDKKLPKEEKIGNVFVYRIGYVGEVKNVADSFRFPLHYNKYFYTVLGAWKAFLISRKIKFDLIWSIMANYAGFASLFFKMFNPKIPFLLTLQEGDPFEYTKKRVGVLYPLFKMIFTKADHVQAISNYLAEYAKAMGAKDVSVVPNGVNVEKFELRDMNHELRKKTRNELGLKADDVALVTTSRLVIKNGVGDVISALVKLPHNVKFVIFGDGYLKENLEFKIKNLELEDRVIMKGLIDHKDMPRYLKACDIFIRPSLSEGFGNSFIEAMAAGLPVIATPVGGIPDFLKDSSLKNHNETNIQTGYFCEPENIDSIAETIMRAINDIGQNKVVENAYKMVKEKYDWNHISSQMKEVFESISIKK